MSPGTVHWFVGAARVAAKDARTAPPWHAPPVTPADDLRRPVILPPWWRGGAPREPLGESFARARWLLATYWLLLVSGYVALVGAAFRFGGANADVAALLPMLVAASTFGVAGGNLLALLRLRAWVVQSTVWGFIALSCVVALSAGPWIAGAALSFLTGLGCGHAAMQRRSLLVALWGPAVCWAGAILPVLEGHGGIRRWEIGVKEGVWDPTALALLGSLAALYLAFLAGQSSYHNAVWAAGGTESQDTQVHARVEPTLHLTRRGALALALLGALVTATTALVAPYLWRTGPADARREHPGAPPTTPPPRDGEGHRRRPARPDRQALRDAVLRAAHHAREQVEDVLPFLPLFVLNRPVRRWWRLRRLRRGGRREEPTERALRRWEYVVVALGDVGIRVLPGDTADELVAKVDAQRAALGLGSIPELHAAASEVDRVRFGLGIPAGTIAALEDHAVRAYEEIRAPMTRGQQLRCWWRRMT